MQRFGNWIIKNLPRILVILLFVYTILPILSAIFFHFNLTRFGWWIQTVYRPLCHQRAERSFFLFGPKLSYTLDELRQHGYTETFTGYHFIGNPSVGYKIAFCTRDTLMYGSMAIAGLIAILTKIKIKVTWWLLTLLIAPIMIDGTTQLISEIVFISRSNLPNHLAKPFYLSNNLTRSLTGGLFGTGMGLILFSELRDAVKVQIQDLTNTKHEKQRRKRISN